MLPLITSAREWIIDRGTSAYMVVIDPTISQFQATIKQFVQLPNGVCLLVFKTSFFSFEPNFVLQNILHIPNFNRNLISMKSLIFYIHCLVHFTPYFYVIPARTLRKLFGLGEAHNGIYYLKGVASHFVSSMPHGSSYCLWN